MRTLLAAIAPMLLCLVPTALPAREPADSPTSKPLRIGAVAYSPDAVTIWRDMRVYFARKGMPIDYVLYSNYDALVQALRDGQVDLAWNTPLAHARFHRACGSSQALVMRDVDRDYRCRLIVRKDAGIATLADLAGKTMVLGSCDAAEATVLPVHFLKKEGVSFGKLKIVRLHREVDEKGSPCSSESHVLKALQVGRGDAGVIGARLWQYLEKNQPQEAAKFKVLWTSPAFTHCVFTARKDFDRKLGERFTKLMVEMDSKDAIAGEILRLEGASRWINGSQDGFQELLKALGDEEATTLGR